jgi:uncharacterized protein YecT (DUF1311 family)
LRSGALITSLLFIGNSLTAQTPADTALNAFLWNYLHSQGEPDVANTQYYAGFADLNSDGKDEAIVYFLGSNSCGSGGCSARIFTAEGSWYRLVSSVSIAQSPIRVLDSVNNGWHSLGVGVRGGGIQPGYEAELPFDGKRYPFNPTVPPAHPLPDHAPGRIVIPYFDPAHVRTLARPPGPSFDCAKAATPSEKLICEDPELASLDQDMADAYGDLLAHTPFANRPALRKAQSGWLADYSGRCNAAPGQRRTCVTQALTERTATLRKR